MVNDAALEAEAVAAREFSVGFRGYSQSEVRAFLEEVASELRASRRREEQLRQSVTDAEDRALTRPLSEEEFEVALGREAGQVIHAAREGAAEIRARAEEQVARMVEEISGQGSRAEQEAEALLARRSEEAEQVAATLLAEARDEADTSIDRAKTEGRAMVAEAQEVRERVLRDLVRRRRVSHQHLEQLRAGRERLLEAYRVVRATLDEATQELTVADAEARAAAERAALQAGSEPEAGVEAGVEAMEAELAGARDVGLASSGARFIGFGQFGSKETSESDAEPAVAEGGAEFEAAVEPVLSLADEGHDDNDGGAAEPVIPVALELEPDVDVDVFAEVEFDSGPEAVDEVEVEPEAVLDVEPEPTTTEAVGEPEPEPEPEPEHASQPEPEREPEREPEPEVDEATRTQGLAEPPTEPVPEIVSDPDPAREHSSESEGRPEVEELFARLRGEETMPPAQRDVASIRDAPSTPAGEVEASPEPEPEPEPEPPTGPDNEEILQTRDADIESVEQSLVRSLKRVLADEQNEVLDILRRGGAAVTLADLLPGPSDHTARYLAVAGPVLAEGAGRGVTGSRHAPPVDDLAVNLAATVADDLRSRLQRALEAAGGDEGPLAEGISAAYREWKTARVELLARHMAAAAHSRGRYSSSEGRVRWVVDAEEGPCPDCDDNALAGAITVGQPFPTGQRHPPAHAGCRCTVVGEPSAL